MREIKFRAWDGEKMCYDYLVARPQFANVLAVMCDEDFAKSQYGLKEWKLMQFTGLQDKNGKEIYEGDIISHFYYIGTETFEVKWIEESCAYGLKSNNRVMMPTRFCEKYMEVIGNIYENPELLSVKERFSDIANGRD